MSCHMRASLFNGASIMLRCGVALGYPDSSANLSNVPTDRLEVPEFCRFQGFATRFNFRTPKFRLPVVKSAFDKAGQNFQNSLDLISTPPATARAISTLRTSLLLFPLCTFLVAGKEEACHFRSYTMFEKQWQQAGRYSEMIEHVTLC